jgi:Outer membrane protein beta-barrel domain
VGPVGTAAASGQVENQIAPGIAAAQLPAAGATGRAVVGTTAPRAEASTAGAAAAANWEALAQLGPRPVPFATPVGAWVAPARVLPGPEPAPLPAIILRRWAVQVLAGPALTYRVLGTRAVLATATPPVYTYPGAGISANTTADLAQLERPALGGGVQASLQYTFARNWDLRAGLGYSEFATRLALQQVRPTAFSRSPDSMTSTHRRDTYRFLTVPVRLGYGRNLSARWRVSLLAGLDAAFYLGGTTTEGSACACQPRTWGLSGSPYRAFSVGASLGGEVRYRLNERWALLAQPTGTYLLTPLSKRSTNYYERHLWGASALLGAAWDLR